MGFVKDLHTEEKMAPAVGVLYSAVSENVERLKSIVSGISPELLEYKGEHGDQNSIAQLISHVDTRWVFRLRQENLPRELEEAIGPMTDENGLLPEVKGVPLSVLLSRYDKVLEELKNTAGQLTEEDLLKTVPYEGDLATIRWGIWHMSDHNRYHQAHIQALINAFRKRGG